MADSNRRQGKSHVGENQEYLLKFNMHSTRVLLLRSVHNPNEVE